MPRATVFLITLVFVLASDGSAQAVPSPGDRIRIKQVDGTVLTGTLTTLSPETIQLSVGSDEGITEVRVARIEILETSLGQHHNYPKYIGTTAAVTSLVGAMIGASVEPCSGTGFCIGPDSRAEGLLIGFAFGAIVGLPLGAVMGALITGERWNPVPLPPRATSGLTIRPLIGSGVGFAGSIRVGGF